MCLILHCQFEAYTYYTVTYIFNRNCYSYNSTVIILYPKLAQLP